MQPLLLRLRYLRSREALATVVLPVMMVWSWWAKEADVAWPLRTAALALVAWVLAQGTLYWHLKLRAIEGDGALPSWFHRLYRGFKWSNLIAIGAMLAMLLLADRDALTNADLGWTLALLAGAVLEQINYFHYQLMYDTRAAVAYLLRHRRLRKAALGIDIARSAAMAARAAPG